MYDDFLYSDNISGMYLYKVYDKDKLVEVGFLDSYCLDEAINRLLFEIPKNFSFKVISLDNVILAVHDPNIKKRVVKSYDRSKVITL